MRVMGAKTMARAGVVATACALGAVCAHADGFSTRPAVDGPAASQVTVVETRQAPQGRPDMWGILYVKNQQELFAGQTVRLGAHVGNNGDGPSPATTLRYYRSTNATFGEESDTVLGTSSVPELAAGARAWASEMTVTVTVSDSGFYGFCVDSVPRETNTGNNCRSWRITVREAPEVLPDLALEMFAAPTRVLAGRTHTVVAQVRNAGDGASPATTLRFYRSTDATFGESDTLVGTSSVPELAASELSARFSVVGLTASSGSGPFYYGACVDSVPRETNSWNNCKASVRVSVYTLGPPDLVVWAPWVNDNDLPAGKLFTVGASVRNTGEMASPATTLRFYRSTDATIDRSDLEVGRTWVRRLPASWGTGGLWVDLFAPSSPGPYYYGACVDTVTDETNTQNNCGGSVLVTVRETQQAPQGQSRHTVEFDSVPKRHDGQSPFDVKLRFSTPPEGLTGQSFADGLLDVIGATVSRARQLDDITSRSDEGGDATWEVTLDPVGIDDITLRVPARACDEAHAVCIDGEPLSEAVEATVPGTPMTASFPQAPATHDGTSAFEFDMGFSHEPVGFSYRTVRDALFDIEGGRIERVRRRERGSNRLWRVKVVPAHTGDVTLAVRETTECAAQHAACGAGGRKLAGTARLTVRGSDSPALPAVAIAAPATTPVTEGAALEFTLTRTGETDAALTVEVAVAETGAAVSGAPPASVRFDVGSASAVLSVATEDDEAVEGASTVTATVSSGSGYTVDGTSGSAEVVVEDDDAAPVVSTASPIEVAENTTAVVTLAATDEDTAAGDLSWSIPEGAAGGADTAQFALTAEGALTFNAAKDYEAPDDADGDGAYEVTVRVTDGANPVDAALVVRLIDVDEVAPVLSSASVHGDALTLTFSEALDGDSAPSASSFAVTVADAARSVDAVAVSQSTVTLTLSSAVSSSETVTVGYTAPAGGDAQPLRDTAGNAVASFTNADVTNEIAALPVVSIAPSTTPVTEGTAAAFTVSRTGATDAALTVEVAVAETGASVSGAPPASVNFDVGSDSATLSVATEDDEAVEDASTVTATVSSGEGYTVDGTSGSAEVVVEDDDAAPVVSTASPIEVAENTTAVATLTATDEDTAAEDLAWSIPEGADGGADASKFALTAEGALSFKAAKDYEAPDDADTDGEYEVTVRVTDGANPVDAALVVRLTDADDAAPALSSASVDGATLTLTFGEALDEDSKPPASAFAVRVGETAHNVEAVALSGSTAVLTLSPAVTADETVTVGYTAPEGPEAVALQDGAGNRVASFAASEVENGTAPTLPVVSIAPASTPVTEGAAAAFVLRRTGATAAALTVSVSVSEAGSVLDGARPSSATFAAGSAEARLGVATANDAVDEADARVSASIVAGSGYEVDGENASAGVDVFDDDAAPAAAVELWSTTMTWTDLGNNWFGGFADAFSNPGWSEDGRDFRIWFISYDAGSRVLSMSHDGSGGRIAEPGQLALHVGGLTVEPGEAISTFAGAGYARVSDVDSQWQVGEQVTVRLTRTSDEAAPAPVGPGLSVADAQVNEASGAPLRFRVTLDAPAQSTVSVRYRTSDGTAQAGADYVAAHGAVRFARGESAKTVEVAVLPDNHDEGSETMTLTLSEPHGASVADATATGTISNTDAIPKAWIARFGRTVAEQAIDAVEARFAAPRVPGFAGTLAGQPMSGLDYATPDDVQASDTRRSFETLAGWLGGTAGEDEVQGIGTRTLSSLELLSTSSFSLTEGTAESGFAAFWGRGAVTRFDGRDGEMTVDGEVASAMLGADFSRDALLGGLMLSHSRGEGGYRSPDGNGEVESTLTALFPYARYALSERVSVWGMGGYGEGTLTVTPEGQASLRPDMDFLMGALGVRGVLVDGGHDGATLAAKSDAMAVRTSTDAVSGSGGSLEAAQAGVTRVRFALEGSRPFGLGGGAVLTPSLELGVRHDGGDAETGTGVEAGAGIHYSAGAFSIEGRVHTLIAHEDSGYEDWGASGALRVNPSPSGRGLSLSLAPVWGNASPGSEGLWSARDATAFALDEDAQAQGRLEAELGYGVGLSGSAGVLTPYTGLMLGNGDSRTYRAGARWRLASDATLSLEGARNTGASGEDPASSVVLRASVRF